ncbi:TrkH family potassium uptake protein [Thermoactinospora rubra]|uniref:TrkH family potassium uptake protein n=1 Tax=Thermoactinospora rubra TaxID=1088767 RepID=UPI000A0FD856|nr:potassium transporter TrkG [Thermoactinospora rubra]
MRRAAARRRWTAAFLDRFHHPAQVTPTGFGLTILAGTGLLTSPLASTSGEPADVLTALFTATSAVCVTGLTMADTASRWSTFGEVVIALLIQVGGLGIMTFATLFTILVAGRLGLRARLLAQAETKALSMSDVRHVVRRVVLFSLACEAVITVALTARFMATYGEPFGRALYLAAFHAISAFNNAGFALWSDSLVRFATDPWILLPVALAVIIGSLGFPVVFELARTWRHPSRWSILTRVTVWVTLILLGVGTLLLLLTEWRNPATLAPLDDSGKLLAAFFATAMRTAGFNSIDVSQMYPSSWLVMDLLMFVGGGTASVAGGIKVTTFGLLGFIIWAELRGESRVNIGHRRLSEAAQRQVVVVTLVGVMLVALSSYLLMLLTPHSLDQILFETISAFATVGLSVGVTADATAPGHVLLILLMFIGRIGPLTLGSALALRERTRRYELPEERVIVG